MKTHPSEFLAWTYKRSFELLHRYTNIYENIFKMVNYIL